MWNLQISNQKRPIFAAYLTQASLDVVPLFYLVVLNARPLVAYKSILYGQGQKIERLENKHLRVSCGI